MLTIRMQNIKSAPFCPIFETPTAEAQQQANSSRALLAIFEKVDSKYCQRLNILVGCVCAIHNDKITLLLPKSESVGVWYCARLILLKCVLLPPILPGSIWTASLVKIFSLPAFVHAQNLHSGNIHRWRWFSLLMAIQIHWCNGLFYISTNLHIIWKHFVLKACYE